MRTDGRANDELRPIRFIPHFISTSLGSCLVEMGKTRVLTTVTYEDSVPLFLRNTKKGWLTSEYSMLPGSSSKRIQRERSKIGGRTYEIQRLLGRSLRTCIDLNTLGERSLYVDCDVLEADGGTRTAAINGAFIALSLALDELHKKLNLPELKITQHIAAVSVGIIDGDVRLDLHYDDDARAEVDMNIVKNTRGEYVEIQGTAENKTFSKEKLDEMLTVADKGLEQIFKEQSQCLKKLSLPQTSL